MKAVITILMIVAGICFPLFLIGAIAFRKDDKEYRVNKKLPSRKTIFFIILTDISLGFLFAGVHTLYGKGVTQFDMTINWLLNLAILTGFIPVGTILAMLFYFLLLITINGLMGFYNRTRYKLFRRRRKNDDKW